MCCRRRFGALWQEFPPMVAGGQRQSPAFLAWKFYCCFPVEPCIGKRRRERAASWNLKIRRREQYAVFICTFS